MPTYEYECTNCGHRFEEFQNITAEPLKTCPVCAGEVRRLISTGGGLIFKGSGFYITDYRSEDYKKQAKKDQPESTGSSEKKTSTKTDSSATSTGTTGKKDSQT